MSRQHQSPFENPVVPTPDASSGWNGSGGGLDQGSGPNGLQQTPWQNPVVPTPSGGESGGPFGNPARYAEVDGVGTQVGTTHAAEITPKQHVTIDKR